MTTPVWVELVCGGCSASIAGRWARGQAIPRRNMARFAKKAQWRVVAGDWYCRRCANVKEAAIEAEKQETPA